jgi:hypothetical protein
MPVNTAVFHIRFTGRSSLLSFTFSNLILLADAVVRFLKRFPFDKPGRDAHGKNLRVFCFLVERLWCI